MANVRFWHEADILTVGANVGFRGNSGHDVVEPECPFLTQSGHWQPEFAVMHNAAASMVE